ncbi:MULTISPECIES: glycosyltransferase family 1 protein [unclassified Clostridium]|uniref:glycosyltransferase family 1 protein n=1 Tax=unclassified Clostridium TaxID=2614128 RepID=UPI000E83167A|nr:glycosyltransferase family 1 protein [Clostridium sp.]
MKRNKVLHIVGGMDVGGTETMLMNLYRKVYKEIQFDFVSYYHKEGYYDEEIRKLGGIIIKLDPPSEVGVIKSVINLMKIIKNDDEYSAVHAHTLFNCGVGVLAAKLVGVKVRISHAHTTKDCSKSLIKRLYISIMKGLIKGFSTNFLSCSDAAGKYLFGYSTLKDDRYCKLPNYIDYERFINNEGSSYIRKKLGINNDDILIGNVGRFIRVKNHNFLINLMSNLVRINPKFKCILIGDGDLRGPIEEKIKKLNLENNIHLLGIRDDVNNILKEIDLFILPSTYEGLGLVLLEAQASGVPCLTSTAIQPEADLHLDLLKRLNLEAGIEIWSNTVMKMLEQSKVDKMLIKRTFEFHGYRIEDVKGKLYKLYGIELEGNKYEKCANSIL